MAISPKCATAIRAAAAGRQISDARLQLIDEAIRAQAQQLARADNPRWLSLTREQRTTEAAAAAMADVQAQAALKEFRASQQVLRTAEAAQRIALQRSINTLTESQATTRVIEQAMIDGDSITKDSIGNMGALLDAAEAKDGTTVLRNLGMRVLGMDNPAMTADIVREVFRKGDGSTGNVAAKKATQAWLDTIERLRVRFNSAGGDIGKLGYGYLTQAHDAVRVKEAGAQAWAAKVFPLLDRTQYVRADGQLMSPDELGRLLLAAHKTLAMGGLNKTEPGQFAGSGARANKGADHRVLHFQDGDAWMAYMKDFGEGSLYDAMIGHVGKMGRDIALVESFGPNPEQWFRVQSDIAKRADTPNGKTAREFVDSRSFGNTPEAYWKLATGATGTPENRLVARIGSDLRNVQTAAKIAWGPFSAMADVATIAQTLHFNRIPYFEMVQAARTRLSAEHRAAMVSHGIIADSLVNTLNRFTGDHLTHGLTGRITNGVMNISLMNGWTNTLRGAFSDVLMHNWAKKLGSKWSDLSEWDRYLMNRKGLTEADWGVITQAKTTEINGRSYLTPDGIHVLSDADVQAARPGEMQALRDRIDAQTIELAARNAHDQGWIRGRIDKFDDARNELNRAVRDRAGKRLAANEKATGPMLERMNLLDAQREQAQLHADMEADFNRFATQDDVRSFLNAVEDGASADKTDVQQAKPVVRAGLESAETIGRRYGVQKGLLERRIVEAQNRIAAMDREAGRATNADAKAAQKKAVDMGAELADFIKRSSERQQRRQFVIDRLTREEAPQVAAEAKRLRESAATRWHSFVTDESHFAVVNPDAATRAIVTGGGAPAGSPTGEFFRTVWQFKSFPIAMLSRHWRRVLETPQGLEGAPRGFGAESAAGGMVNKVAVLAALGLTTTLMGAIQTQARQVIAGKDPIDMTGEHAGKFWMKAFAAGGGSGFLADVLMAPLDDPSRRWQGHLGMAGPVAGAAGGLIDVAKAKHKGADAAGWVSDQLPFVDMWQTRAAYEHWFLHSAQENLNPGYLSRMQRRGQKQWGQDWYWEPGTTAPDRAPDFAGAFGQ